MPFVSLGLWTQACQQWLIAKMIKSLYTPPVFQIVTSQVILRANELSSVVRLSRCSEITVGIKPQRGHTPLSLSLSLSALPPPRAPQSPRPITSQIFNWWFSAWAAWALPGWAAHCTGCRAKIKWATHQWTFLPALSLNSINLSRWFSHLQINTGRVFAVIFQVYCIVINKHCLL